MYGRTNLGLGKWMKRGKQCKASETLRGIVEGPRRVGKVVRPNCVPKLLLRRTHEVVLFVHIAERRALLASEAMLHP